jgi:hypothetical protein
MFLTMARVRRSCRLDSREWTWKPKKTGPEPEGGKREPKKHGECCVLSEHFGNVYSSRKVFDMVQ